MNNKPFSSGNDLTVVQITVNEIEKLLRTKSLA